MTKRETIIARKQLAKASKLLSILDRSALLIGMPRLAGKRGVAALEVFRLRDWAVMARQKGIVPPSAECVAMLHRLVEERGAPVAQPQQMPLRKTTPAPFPAVRKRESA